MIFDVAIIGGSFAGLSAGLQLARARRRIAIFDTGMQRNRLAASSHGFLANDGRAPGAIVADGRAQMAAYSTVQWFDSAVTGVTGRIDAFDLEWAEGTQRARRVILAMGLADELPAIPGLAERWGRSVFHCPYCHGYELQQGRIGVLASGPNSLRQALLLAEWGRVTFFLNGSLVLSAADVLELTARNVTVEVTPVANVSGTARVVLTDGRSQDFAGLFTVSQTRPASPLAAQLGCEHEVGQMGPFVKTGPMKDTSVSGVFACGDLARMASNVAIAVADGAIAGISAHSSLVFQP